MNCSNNNMTQLPDNLLPNTEQLIMVGNHLKTIDSVAKDLPHLISLDLEKCNISEISTQGFQALLLHSDNLKLPNNKLQHISSVIQTTTYNTSLWLSKNLFECNCDMMWMRDWLLNATNVMDKDNITCIGGKWNGWCSLRCNQWTHGQDIVTHFVINNAIFQGMQLFIWTGPQWVV